MQKLLRSTAFRIGIPLAVALIVGFLVLPNTVFAKSNVIKGFDCWLLASDSGLAEDVVSTNSLSVVSASGNAKLTCHFKYVGAGLPTRALNLRHFTCGTYVGLTTDSKMVITPSGQINLTCQVKAHNAASFNPNSFRMSAAGPHGHGGGLVTGANP